MSAHVLVADDEARSAIAAGCASARGFRGDGGQLGRAGVADVCGDRPDVVLLDLVLGDITGIDVLRRIRQLSPETKVILISAHATLEQAVEAMPAR